MSEMCCTRLAENTGRKNCEKIAICAPSHNFVGLYLCNYGSRHLKKKLVKQQFSSTRPHNVVNFGPLTAEIGWQVWGTPANFSVFCVLAFLLHRRQSMEVKT